MTQVSTAGSEPKAGKQAPKDNENQPGSFDKKLMSKIAKFADIREEVKKGREKLNAQLAAAQAELIDEGFNKDALKAAVKYADTPEEKRKMFDLTYSFAREALGLPIQGDMLLEASIQRKTEAHSNKPH